MPPIFQSTNLHFALEKENHCGSQQGPVTCGSWIGRPENNLVVLGRSTHCHSCPSLLDIFSFDTKTYSLSTSPVVCFALEEEGHPIAIAVHPEGDDFISFFTNGSCKLFELYGHKTSMKLLTKELPPLKGAGKQECSTFNVDGSKFAAGGLDGHLRILQWPSLLVIMDEP